jgi:hypothetical protein
MTSESRLTSDEVAVYLAAVDWLVDLVDRPEVVAAWGQDSAVARYSVGGLAAHAVQGGVVRVTQVLHDPEPSDAHTVTVPDFFGPNRVADPDVDDPLFVALRARAEDVAGQGPKALWEAGRSARAELSTLLPVTPANRAMPVVRIRGGSVPLRSYLRTRLLEVVVHGDDLVASVRGLGTPDPPAAAVEACLALCVELARARIGDLAALRAFTRSERTAPDALRVL